MSNKFTPEYLKKFLAAHAPIDRFYVIQCGGIGSEVITYFDEAWNSFDLIIDENDLYIEAIGFLKKNGAPVFYNENDALCYEKMVKKNKSLN